ncbi:hypothetical protein K2173_004840 [Erythroxylum novogranatense]|uniref:Uncharacterized protein n=1 Tax=Erythroxylum novogranatense TaxID=1862640 RepID=A0AAV8TAV1_9ROSI|nr:hypothetical protein K2173_004840 [Erythroxylum novogranatense]
MRCLLSTIVLDGPANAFFALLSHYCIPLHSFKYVYNALVESTSFDLSSSTITTYDVRIQHKNFIEIIDKEPQLWRVREDECYLEEHYFPTLLSMVDPNGCTHYTLTMVNWNGTIDGHLYTYRPNEIAVSHS